MACSQGSTLKSHESTSLPITVTIINRSRGDINLQHLFLTHLQQLAHGSMR
jgi:hypothetical protein